MRPEGNPLDLNNLPEEYGKQALEESSTTTAASTDTTRFKKKKSGGKDDSAKVYECRFCSLKFCKSQALGGHMNRHRQERETETLNRARQLVFSNEGHMGSLRDLNLGSTQPIPPAGGLIQHRGGSIGDPSLQYRPVYPRLPTQPPPLKPYVYPTSSTRPIPYPPSYPLSHPSVGDYFIGHVLDGSSSQRQPHHPGYGPDSSYTCFGAPLARSFPMEGVQAPMTRDTAGNQADGMNWGCSYGHDQHMDSSSNMDRFRDNF